MPVAEVSGFSLEIISWPLFALRADVSDACRDSDGFTVFWHLQLFEFVRDEPAEFASL